MKTAIPIFIIIACLVGGILFYRGCTSGPPREDKKALDSAYTGWQVEKGDVLHRFDSLLIASKQKDLRIDTLIKEQIEGQKDLSSRGQIIDHTIESGNQARAAHDTVWIVQNCDTLIQEVKSGKLAVGDYITLTDSIGKVYEERIRVEKAISANFQSAFLHADTIIDFQKSKYNSLYLDDTRKSLQLKIYKPMAIAGVVVIAATVLKLFIK